MRKLNTRWLGKLSYSEAYDLQLGLHKSVSNSLENDDYLLLLEHDNVITSGRTSKEGNLLVSLDHLKEMKIVGKNTPLLNKFIIKKTSQFYKILS